MSTSDSTRRLIRTIIKTILVCNAPKPLTAREISDVINSNNFGLRGKHVSPRLVTTYIREDWSRVSNSMLHEVHGEKGLDGRYSFWMPKRSE